LTNRSQIASELLAANAYAVKLTDKNKLFDRSRNGSKGCFRNESIQHIPLTVGADWKLPKSGVFEFDFIYLYQAREQAPLESAQFDILYGTISRSSASISTKIRVSTTKR